MGYVNSHKIHGLCRLTQDKWVMPTHTRFMGYVLFNCNIKLYKVKFTTIPTKIGFKLRMTLNCWQSIQVKSKKTKHKTIKDTIILYFCILFDVIEIWLNILDTYEMTQSKCTFYRL